MAPFFLAEMQKRWIYSDYITSYSQAVGWQNYAEYAASVSIHPIFEVNLICVCLKYEDKYK